MRSPIDGKPGKGINWRSVYSGSELYSSRDAVSYLGSSYLYKASEPSSGHAPTNQTYWDVLVAAIPTVGSIAVSLEGDYNGSVEHVSVQVLDGDGASLAKKVPITYWLSQSPLGSVYGTLFSMAPTSGHGNIVKEFATNYVVGMTNETGALRITVIGLTSPNLYINFIVGEVFQASSSTLQSSGGEGSD